MQRRPRTARRRPARSTPPSARQPSIIMRWRAALNGVVSAAARRPIVSYALAGVLLVLLLFIWRWNILASPPYWDSAMGLCLEANFLAETDFDYERLFTTEPRFNEGGSAIYLISFLPSLLAVLMRWLPSPQAVFIAYRLISFAATAVLLLTVFWILRPRIGWVGAALVPAAILTTPAFAAQVDLIGMDLFVAVWGVISGALLVQRRFAAVGVVSLVAFFTKITGGLLAVAAVPVTLIALLSAYFRRDRAAERRCWIGLGTQLLAVAVILAFALWLMGLESSEAESYELDASKGLSSLAIYAQLVPDLAILFFVTLAGWIWLTGRRVLEVMRSDKKTGDRNARWSSLAAVVIPEPMILFGWMLIFGMLAGLLVTYVIPRYLTLPLPFLLMILGILLFSSPQRRPWAAGAMLVLIAFNLANSYGRFFPSFPVEHPMDWRNGAQLERSREYLYDHQQNIEAVEQMALEAADTRILAPPPFVHFLSLPRLGYIDEPLKGYALHTFTSPTFPPVERLRDDPPTDLTFIAVMNRFYGLILFEQRVSIPPMTAGDRLVYKGAPLDPIRPHSGLQVYQKTAGERLTGLEKKRWYLHRLWPSDEQEDRARQLLADQDFDDATKLYLEILEKNPLAARARFQLASLMALAGRLDEARNNYETFIEQNPDVAAAHRNLAEILMEQGEFEEAGNHLQTAIRLDPETAADSRGKLGVALFQLGELEQAVAELNQALEQGADSRQYGFFHGLALAAHGKTAEAADAWRNVIARAGPHGPSYFELARLAAQEGRYAWAIGDLRKAMAAAPRWPEPLNYLAWLLATHPDERFRDGQLAVRLAETALQLQPEPQASFVDTLAAALAENGQFSQAVIHARRAIELAESSGTPQQVAAYQERLVLYEQGRPYRESAEKEPSAD